MKLKIGRHDYEITGKDKFMDNGACVQLLTQSKETPSWGHRPTPVLSKAAIRQISAFNKIQLRHHYDASVSVFMLDIPNGDKAPPQKPEPPKH